MGEPQSLREFLAWEAPPLVPIIEQGLMYEGNKVIIYGKYKTMKSMIAMRFCLSVAGGEDWLGFSTIGGKKVLYLQLEVQPTLLQKRLIAMKAQPSDLVTIWTEPNLSIDTPEGFSTLTQVLDKYNPDILVVDPIYKVMSGNLIDNHQVKMFIDKFDELIADYQPLSVVLVSHTRKGIYEEMRGSDDLIGGMFFSAWADSIIKVERLSHSQLKVHFEVLRHAEEEIIPRIYTVTDDIDFNWEVGNL